MKNIILIIILTGSFSFCSFAQMKQSGTTNTIVADNDTCNLIDSYLTKLSDDKGFSGGMLIVKDGRKIFSKGYGWADKENKIPFTPQTLASIGSITKAFTAAAIMKLAEQNKISPDDKLKKFFPNVPADKANITIHQLLTHSSGFHEFLKDDGGDYEKINTEEFLNRAFTEPLAFKPGEKAVYTNVGYSILGIIIEKISGTDYEQFLKTNLFDPSGIKNIGYHFPIKPNVPIAIGYQNGKIWGTHQDHFEKAGGGPYWNLKANGGLEASLDEMYLWLNSHTNHTILTETTIAKMFTGHIAEDGYTGESYFGYGCNISKSRRNTKLIGNGGSNGIYFAHILRLTEEGVIFYMVTNESSINASMVLPNVTQLYFTGKIEQDAIEMAGGFKDVQSKIIYDILDKSDVTDLTSALEAENIKVNDDIILWEVGRRLTDENKNDRALILYEYYTKTFPDIVVAWNDMGDVQLALNNKKDAIRCYEQALKIRPDNPRAKESLEKMKTR